MLAAVQDWISSMRLTEVLLGDVPTQSHHTMCHCPRTAAGTGAAGTGAAAGAAEIAMLSTPQAAPGSRNASNTGPAARNLVQQ